MRRAVIIFLLLIAVFVVLGLGVTWIARNRDTANHAGCRNNLRALAMLGAPYTYKDGTILRIKSDKPVLEIWPGTVMNNNLKLDERLSWVYFALPTLDERSVNAGDLVRSIDAKTAWDSPQNRDPSTKLLRTLICPADVPSNPPGEPAPTMYVGIAGLGPDAATLPLTDPLSPKAGAFRYDAPTPIELIQKHDGTSQTFLFGQTIHKIGPWIRGGYSTVRGIESGIPILARVGGQFGGPFADGSYFAFVDGSVKSSSYGTDPEVLKSLATIAGGSVKWDD